MSIEGITEAQREFPLFDHYRLVKYLSLFIQNFQSFSALEKLVYNMSN